MSSYVREKVLRIPLERTNFGEILMSKNPEGWEDDGLGCADDTFPELFKYATPHMFQSSPTYEDYIDYVLEYEYDACCGDFGKTRAITENEQNKYAPIFHQIDPTINMKDVRLVEFCYYNGCEADDLYDEDCDDFYEEV